MTPGVLLARRNLWKTALIVALMALFIRLGVWQLDRRLQRQAENAALAAQIAAPALALEGDSAESDPTSLVNRTVTAAGTFDFERQMAVKLQTLDGQPGVYLVAPLVLPDGERAVLVNRGWIPAAQAAPAQWGQFDEPGSLTVSGTAQASERLPRSAEATLSAIAPGQKEIFRIDIPAIQLQMPYELLPVYVLQAPDGRNLPVRLEPEIDLSAGPHLSYAIQWFSFAAMAPAFYLYFLYRQERTADDRPRAASAPRATP